MSHPFCGLRLIFAGTPDFAAHHLKALIDNSQHEIVAVYTQPDRPAGRGKKLSPSPVKKLALQHELPVFQPHSLKAQPLKAPPTKDSHVQQELLALKADVMIVVAYGLILPQAVLDIPRFGCLNVHGSLLPRWRGAAPIQRAIAAGDKATGITIMQMDRGLDTGDMLVKRDCEMTKEETSASLHDKLMVLGTDALLETLDQLQRNDLRPEAQDDANATYAEKISKEEAKIIWSEAAQQIETKIRAYNPSPIAYTFLNGSRIKIYKAEVVKAHSVDFQLNDTKEGQILAADEKGLLIACGKNSLLVGQCQLPNKKVMPVADIINGNSELFSVGDSFE
jgi:methionyl-tRNA formyltransferase